MKVWQKIWKFLRGEKERFLVGIVFASVAFGVSFFFLLKRDIFLERSWFEGVGRFIEVDESGWKTKAEKYFQDRHPDLGVCVSEWLGRDERYIYLGLGCGKFQQHLGEISVDGQQTFYPTRIELDGESFTDIDQVETTKDSGAVRSLLPKKAFDMYRWKSHRDKFLKLGWEKTSSTSSL